MNIMRVNEQVALVLGHTYNKSKCGCTKILFCWQCKL